MEHFAFTVQGWRTPQKQIKAKWSRCCSRPKTNLKNREVFPSFPSWFIFVFVFSVGEGVVWWRFISKHEHWNFVGDFALCCLGIFYHPPHLKNCFFKIKISMNSVLQSFPWPPLCPWRAGGSSFAPCSLRMHNNGPKHIHTCSKSCMFWRILPDWASCKSVKLITCLSLTM